MEAQVDIFGGFRPALDEAGSGASVLRNWRTDAEGVNVPRPPMAAYSLTGITAGTTVIGAYEFRGDLVLVGSDRAIYLIQRSAPATAIALSTASASTRLDGTGRPVFAEDASDLFIAGGGEIQKWDGGGTTARLGAGPSICTHVTSIGQRLVATDAADPTTSTQFFYSDLGDGSDASWGVLNYQTAESRPDKVLAVYENTSELFVFGETTLEVYGIGIDPAAPFDRINTVNVGLGAVYSPVRFDDTWMFLDDSRRFVRSDGHSNTIEPFGDDIVTLVRSMGTVSDAFGWRERQGRYDLAVWHFPTEGRTFEFSPAEKRWSERAVYDVTADRKPAPIGCYAFWSSRQKHIIGRNDTNGLATIDDSAASDLGLPLLCERRTGWSDYGIKKRKRSTRLIVTCRRGQADQGTTPGALEIRKQDDGGNWSGWKSVPLGVKGDGNPTGLVHLGGVFRRRRLDLRCSASVPYSLVSVVDDVEEVRT